MASFASSSDTRCVGFFGMLNRMAQRRGDVQRRKHLRSRGFDVGFEPFDAPVLVAVFRLDPLELGGGLLLVLLGRGGWPAAARPAEAVRARGAPRAPPAPRALLRRARRATRSARG